MVEDELANLNDRPRKQLACSWAVGEHMCTWCSCMTHFFEEPGAPISEEQDSGAGSSVPTKAAPRPATARPFDFTRDMLARIYPGIFGSAEEANQTFDDIRGKLYFGLHKYAEPEGYSASCDNRFLCDLLAMDCCTRTGPGRCGTRARSKRQHADQSDSSSSIGADGGAGSSPQEHGGDPYSSGHELRNVTTEEDNDGDNGGVESGDGCGGSGDSGDSAGARQVQRSSSRKDPRADIFHVEQIRTMAANEIQKVLASLVDWNPTFPKLAGQLARVIQTAPNVHRRDWEMTCAGIRMLKTRYHTRIAKHLDAPPGFIDRANDGVLWVAILEAAFKDLPEKLPVIFCGVHTIFDGGLRADDREPGSVMEQSILFKCGAEFQILVVVGLIRWRFINPLNYTTGTYLRPYALVLGCCQVVVRVRENSRHLVGADISENEDSESNTSSEEIDNYESDTDSEKDYQPVQDDDIGAIFFVDSKQVFSTHAQHPEVWWQFDERPSSSRWVIISGPGRPGFWITRPNPVITMRPDVRFENEWRIRSVSELDQVVRGGLFTLEIESPGLFKAAESIMSAGSGDFSLRDPTAMRRFLRGVSDAYEEILYEARVKVAHWNWKHKTDWIAFQDITEDNRLPLILRFPGYNRDAGAELTVMLSLGKQNMLSARTDFRYFGDEGPYINARPSQQARLAHELLSFEGCKKVRAGMRLVAACGARAITLSVRPPTGWLKPDDRDPWFDGCHYRPSDLRSFGDVLQMLAAGACPDGPAAVPALSRFSVGKVADGLLQQGTFELRNNARQTWMTVLVQRTLTEEPTAHKNTPRRRIKPTQIDLRIVIKPGNVAPPVVNKDEFALHVLVNYLRQNSLCAENAPNLLIAFRRGGPASLETYHPWPRCFYMNKDKDLERMCLDLIQFLCYVHDGGKPRTSSMNHKTMFCGKELLSLREVPTDFSWKGTVHLEQQPLMDVTIRLVPDDDDDDTLLLQLRVILASSASSVPTCLATRSGVQSASKVRKDALLFLQMCLQILAASKS